MVPTTDWPVLEHDTFNVAAHALQATALAVTSWGGILIPGSAWGGQPHFMLQAQILSGFVDVCSVLCGISFRHTIVCARLDICPNIEKGLFGLKYVSFGKKEKAS